LCVSIADQWSPFNKDGKKKYDGAFLMQLQGDPQSLKRPEDLPKLEVVIDKVSEVDSVLLFLCLLNDDTLNLCQTRVSDKH